MRLNNCKKVSQLNKGFTLVELIVSIAIFAIVGVAIAAFFSMSMRQYKGNSNEVNVQTESQMTWKRLESNILITNAGIWTPNDSQIDLYRYSKGAAHEYTMTSIYYDNSGSSHNIYYQDYYLDDSNEWVKDGDSQVFASLVTSFKIELFDAEGKKITDSSLAKKPAKAKATINYEANERKYDAENTVAIRNSVIATDNIRTIIENVKANENIK